MAREFVEVETHTDINFNTIKTYGWDSTPKNTVIIGMYIKKLISKNVGPDGKPYGPQYLFQDVCGEQFLLKSAGKLAYLLQDDLLGKLMRITFLGKEKMKDSGFKANQFKLEVAVGEDEIEAPVEEPKKTPRKSIPKTPVVAEGGKIEDKTLTPFIPPVSPTVDDDDVAF